MIFFFLFHLSASTYFYNVTSTFEELNLFIEPQDIVEIQLPREIVVDFSSWLELKELYLELYLSDKSKATKTPDYMFDYSKNLIKIILPEKQFYMRLTNEGDKKYNINVSVNEYFKEDRTEPFIYGYDNSKGKFKLAIGFIVGIYLILVYFTFAFFCLTSYFKCLSEIR